MLIKMAAECITRMQCGFVSRGNPRTSFYQVVLAVERGRGKIIVQGMNLEAGEAGDRRFRPLPHIPKHIVKISLLEFIHRTRRRAIFEINVSRRTRPLHHIL
ncbi:hypothetical protein SDC9_131997 [bioreactor metagenome]|uniref:Uncharacterized protein n=1 Tax=bioreactor metagenome TaxID=1076179 RepID=A0A645D6N6_9ZZZZ